MIAQGFRLMVVGMGVVFAFLVLMVWLMHASAAVCRRLAPATEEEAVAGAAGLAGSTTPALRQTGGGEDHGDEAHAAAEVAAIVAAVRARWPG